MVKDSKSKVHHLEQFATALAEMEDCDVSEIGEELLYYVNEWKKEIGHIDEE